MNDIRIIEFPYLEKNGSKWRPAVQLTLPDKYSTAVFAYISTQPMGDQNSVKIDSSDTNGLLETSYIHCNKLTTLPIVNSEKIGVLSQENYSELIKKLNQNLLEYHNS
jgi:PemK-like, MazF-like toxin of type II toxin-antitoxin system